MKRFAIPFLLLFVLMALTVKQAQPPKTLALYNHPSQADAMVTVRTVRTFDPQANNVYHVHTPSELGARSTTNCRVQYVLPAWWEDVREPVREYDTRRYHRPQTARWMQ